MTEIDETIFWDIINSLNQILGLRPLLFLHCEKFDSRISPISKSFSAVSMNETGDNQELKLEAFHLLGANGKSRKARYQIYDCILSHGRQNKIYTCKI